VADAYHEWVGGFKDLKEFTPPAETAIKQVLAYYSQAIGESAQARREGWSHVLAYRKNSKDGLDRGEQQIERLLFERSPIEIVGKKNASLSRCS
jgi:hypothetical protein